MAKSELNDWSRPEYKRSDFGHLVRGKYAKLSKADRAKVESEYHRMKPEDFDAAMSRAKTHRVDEKPLNRSEDADNEMAQMAADPDIERELREIEREFSPAESDGLEIA